MLRRQRTRTAALTAAGIALCAVLVSLGLQRRTSEHTSLAHQVQQAVSNIVRSAAPSIPQEWPATLHDLQEELRRVQLTREQLVGVATDATPALRDMLGGWPTIKGLQVQSMSVSETQATLSLTAPSIETAQECLASWTIPEGWKRDEPQLNTQGDSAFVRVTVQRIDQRASGVSATAQGGTR